MPSWSKVAIRSSGGTKSGLDLSVVAFTKSTIACFAGPSFQEGRVSVGRRRLGERRKARREEDCKRSERREQHATMDADGTRVGIHVRLPAEM